MNTCCSDREGGLGLISFFPHLSENFCPRLSLQCRLIVIDHLSQAPTLILFSSEEWVYLSIYISIYLSLSLKFQSTWSQKKRRAILNFPLAASCLDRVATTRCCCCCCFYVRTSMPLNVTQSVLCLLQCVRTYLTPSQSWPTMERGEKGRKKKKLSFFHILSVGDQILSLLWISREVGIYQDIYFCPRNCSIHPSIHPSIWLHARSLVSSIRTYVFLGIPTQRIFLMDMPKAVCKMQTF